MPMKFISNFILWPLPTGPIRLIVPAQQEATARLAVLTHGQHIRQLTSAQIHDVVKQFKIEWDT